jgi:hypothetical protein
MFGRLATTITALSRRVDRITAQEFVDCRGVTERVEDVMSRAARKGASVVVLRGG